MKPVAWLEPECRETICPEIGYAITITSEHPKDLCWIPLYTAPRELSDEELWELHREHIDEVTCGHSMQTVGFIEFARAILKKASEK
jgi:hypothetical protein